MDLAILIPCYNEEKTIAKVITDFKTELPDAHIYVYDNNSTDNTIQEAKKAGAIVKNEYLQGKGNVVRRMFREIEAHAYILVDGDDTYPAHHAQEMVGLITDKKADMVVGDRLSSTYFTENKRLFHNFGNRLVRYLINLIFGNNVQDIMTGYRAFSKNFIKSFPVISTGFEIETEMTIHALDKRMLIKEIPIDYRDRPEGSISKLNTISDGMKVLLMIMKMFKDYKPFLFFSLLGIFTFIISLISFVPILVNYLQTGFVARFPSLILVGSLWIISLMLFTIGLILDTINKKTSQFYELYLISQEKYNDKSSEEGN